LNAVYDRIEPTLVERVREALGPGRLSTVLGERDPTRIPDLVAPRRSAVAAIVRDARWGPEILLMRRVDRPGDRWSGHVSFPGGMAEARDADLVATAVRETREEVGLDLDVHATRVGRMDDQVAIAHGRTLPMAITPYVFAVNGDPTLTLGPEAREVFWLPMAAVMSGAIDGVRPYKMAGVEHKLPAWLVGEHVVWGLTHRMITRLLEIAGLRA